MSLNITHFKPKYSDDLISLWERASHDRISGIVEPDSSPSEFSENFSPHELGIDAVQLALSGPDLVGFTFLDVFYDDFHSQDEKSFFVNILFVHPDYRKRGIGTSLLQKAELIARKNGYKRLYAEINTENTPMLKLVEKTRWRVRSTSFTIKKTGSLRKIRDLFGKTRDREDLNLRTSTTLVGNRKEIDSTIPRDQDDVSISRVKDNRIPELTELGFSENVLLEAIKGIAVGAYQDDEIIGACVSMGGFIHHIKTRRNGNLRQRMLKKTISMLPIETQEVTVDTDNISLALTTSKWGLRPSITYLNTEGDNLLEVSNLLSEHGIEPARKRFIMVKDLP